MSDSEDLWDNEDSLTDFGVADDGSMIDHEASVDGHVPIGIYEAVNGEIQAFDNLGGRALLREIEPTDQSTLLHNVPQWIRDLDVIDNYDRRMSMSTVSYRFNNPAFNTTAIWHLISHLKNVPFELGRVIEVSSADATTDPNEGKPVRLGSRKGRHPINPRVEPRRAHGQFKSFGTSIELKVEVNLEKGPDFNPALLVREYKVKLFATNIQIPGCGNEDLSDVRRVIALIDRIFDTIYQRVKNPPVEFLRLQTLLSEVGENELKYPKPTDYENIERGNIRIYSRNYTFHYRPLVSDISASGQNSRAINLDKLTKYLQGNDEMTREWEIRSGLSGVCLVYNKSSDSSNRRVQFIFRTPQFCQEDSNRGSQMTKAFVESSGKVNIELTNNYYWRDTLWRIFAFLSNIFGPQCAHTVEPRMPSTISKYTLPEIRAQFEPVNKRIDDGIIYGFIASIDSEVSSDDGYA